MTNKASTKRILRRKSRKRSKRSNSRSKRILHYCKK